MSMEICVLSDKQLSSISEWQDAIETAGFPLRLSFGGLFSELGGFLPAFLYNKRTGFECYHVELKELTETYPNIQFDHEWKYVLAFVWVAISKKCRLSAWRPPPTRVPQMACFSMRKRARFSTLPRRSK
jgi:hypothetical protein